MIEFRLLLYQVKGMLSFSSRVAVSHLYLRNKEYYCGGVEVGL